MAAAGKKSFKKWCCYNFHDRDDKESPLGKSGIPAPEIQKSVLELLGSVEEGPATDEDVQNEMKKMHSYIFDMGGGKYFTNFEEAEDELLKRNFPDIFKNCQKRAMFLPETYLPKVPRAVDTERYEAKKKNLSEQLKKFLKMKDGSESHLIAGDLTEKTVYDTLNKLQNLKPSSSK